MKIIQNARALKLKGVVSRGRPIALNEVLLTDKNYN